jgi:hypothetical protein
MFNNIFFDNFAVYEIMWKNSVQPDRPQMTILCVRFVCWISEATHTHAHTHTDRIFNTYCFQGNNGYANAPQCYVIRRYITCIVKDTSVQITAPLRQTYPVQFRTVPCPRQDGISNLSYPPSVPTLCSRRHNSRSFYNLKSTSEWMWAPLFGPQTVSYGGLYAVYGQTVDWMESWDWISIRSGDSLFIISTRSVGSIRLSYLTDSDFVSRSIKRSKPSVHLVSKYKMEM